MKLIKRFFQVAEKFADKDALICEGEAIKYEELSQKVKGYSNVLQQNGVRYKDGIIVIMDNSVESVVIMLAALNMGIYIVPVSPTLPFKSILKAIEFSHAKHLIARQSFFKSCDNLTDLKLKGGKYCIDGRVEGAIEIKNLTLVQDTFSPPKMTGDETFIISLTSGSTGQPKPIELTQYNKNIRIDRHIDMYDLNEQDVILAATPLYHTLAQRLVLLPLMLGATSVLLTRYTVKRWVEYVVDYNVTFTIAVSAQLNQLCHFLKSESICFNSLKCIVSSSALLKSETKQFLMEKLDCEFHEIYGTSETSTTTSINFNSTNRVRSVGKGIKGTDIKIIDENGNFLGSNELGEIICKTDLMCHGYYKNKDLFGKNLFKGYFRTGDLGYLDNEGYLFYKSRKKEMIITGGINVFPADIEACIMEINGVVECAAFSLHDDIMGEIVSIAVVCSREIKPREIKIHAAKNLADFQQPRHIVFLDSLPKNSMNKLQRYKLRKMVKGV